jgi:flagella basal body P-ring formation protein FlgA
MVTTLHHKQDLSAAGFTYRQSAPWLLSALLLPLIIYTANALAADGTFQTHTSIGNAVVAFITQGIEGEYPHHEIKVSALDPRLKLPTCKAPLSGFLPTGGKLIGNTTIGIRCSGSKPWTIYVSASVKAMRKVVITTRPILRNSAISEADIRLEERDVTTGSDTYIFDPEHVVGKLAKRALPSSISLTPSMLSEPILVRRGQQVIILAQGAGIEVRMAGTALMDGAEGQIIRAKNKRSKRMVEGQVIQPGVIKVNM